MDVLKNLLGMIFKLFGKKQIAAVPVIQKNVKKESHKEEKVSNRTFNPMRWK